jgi:hypothetical protein
LTFFLEENRLARARAYRGIGIGGDASMRRPMTTIVELSAEQADTSTENLYLNRDEIQPSLSPLVQGKLI